MKAIVKDKEIKCPICGNNDFYKKEISIQATEYRDDYFHEDRLYKINKDELECSDCGWTGYFTNDIDPTTDYKENKITYKE